MATRQYIGARYVPKFYHNSVDDSATWESNVVYEPLTYVTLQNGHMYISKKEVPATIGSPASNPTYWLDVGSYNGYIDYLQQQINTLNTDVDTNSKKIDNIRVFNVRDYGAVGDGVTDDTHAFTDMFSDIATLLSGKVLLETNPTMECGYSVYIPRGHYIITSTLNFPTPAVQLSNHPEALLGPCVVYGDECGTNLDFSGAPNNSDGLVFNSFSSVKDLKVTNAKRHGVSMINWNFTLENITVENAGDSGFYFDSPSFVGKVIKCVAYHCNNGFYDAGFSTSLSFDTCYADGCSNYGFAIGITNSAVYTTLNNCAVDGGACPYYLKGGITMLNCGNEACTPTKGAITIGANSNIGIHGHFDFNSTSGSFIFVEGTGSTVDIDGLISYQNTTQNTAALFGGTADYNITCKNIDLRSSNRQLHGAAASLGAMSSGGINAYLDSEGKAIIGKLSSLSQDGGFGGVLIVNAYQSFNSSGNCTTTVLSVGGINHVNSLSQIAKNGATGTGVNLASYTFTLDNQERLIATHDSGSDAAGKPVTFAITILGNVKINHN